MPIPIADVNPLKRDSKSHITMILILINVVVFFLFQFEYNAFFATYNTDAVSAESALGYGLVPSVLWGDNFIAPQFYKIPADYTVVTYMFLHGGLMHMVSNMLILWIFGDNIEQDFGRGHYITFYMLGGIVAGVFHALMNAGSDLPLVGASGAVAAVGAAYLLLHPKAQLWVLLFWFIPVKLPAWTAIVAWIAYQIYETTQSSGAEVAWWAHIGGFGFGIIYVFIFKRHLIAFRFADIFNIFKKTAD